jgi:hypothetical protein
LAHISEQCFISFIYLAVTIGGTPCISFTRDSDTKITCVTPAGSGTRNIVFVAVADQGSTTTAAYFDYPGKQQTFVMIGATW